MIFYRISELMLSTLIQRYDKKKKQNKTKTKKKTKKKKKKKNVSFLMQFKNERLTEILQAVKCHILWSY